MEDIIPAIVIDNGSGTVQVGISGDDQPRASIMTVVGRPKQPGMMVGMDQKDTYIGQEVKSKTQQLNVSYPIDYGIIGNDKWEDMEQIWHHAYYNLLHCNPDEHPVLMTEPPHNPKQNREKLLEIMFEGSQFNVPAFYLANQQVMALFASGRTTGVVVDSGDSVTHTVPIYQGFALSHAIHKIPLAGRDLTQYLIQLIEEEKKFTKDQDTKQDKGREIKEKLCFVAGDFQGVMKDFQERQQETSFKMPDGTTLILQTEIIKCPEILFTPNKLESLTQFNQSGKELQGIQELTFQSIMKCDVDIRQDLYKNILLAGGTTMFKGISDRLRKEIAALAPSNMGPQVFDPPDRKFSVWMGGSILSSLSNFQQMFITRAEAQDFGPSYVHKKCF